MHMRNPYDPYEQAHGESEIKIGDLHWIILIDLVLSSFSQ